MNLRHAAALALVGWFLAMPARVLGDPTPTIPPYEPRHAYDPPCQATLCSSDADCYSHCNCIHRQYGPPPNGWQGGICDDATSGDEPSCSQGQKRKTTK